MEVAAAGELVKLAKIVGEDCWRLAAQLLNGNWYVWQIEGVQGGNFGTCLHSENDPGTGGGGAEGESAHTGEEVDGRKGDVYSVASVGHPANFATGRRANFATGRPANFASGRRAIFSVC